MKLTHLIAGDPTHGVTEYARLLAQHTGGEVRSWDDGSVLPHAPVHVTFTDHLFGTTPDDAVDRVLEAVGDRPLSVSFHDVPQRGEGEERFRRRAAAYVRLAHRAEVAVTNSQHEAGSFHDNGVDVEVIHLPLPQAPEVNIEAEPGTIGVIGFIYPGKGHADIATAATKVGGWRVRALGGYSAGHEDMELPGVEVTGYLSEEYLWEEMARVSLAVCPHRHVSASGSLMRWLAAGRTVLMADSAYAQELAQLCPGQVKPVTDWEQALRSHDAEATDLIPADERWQHSWWDVARMWQDLWVQAFKPWFTGQLRPSPTPAQEVSVIIPHYNDETSLQRVVEAIDASRGIDAVEIIVADDGSRALPTVKSSRWPVKVVSQADFGFRAAAARNLGASHARFPILTFVDGDTIPEPDYLARAASWVSADERAVVVGTRLQDGVEPDWLHEAWQRTRDLEWADSSAWRFILSSVLTISRRFFDLLGGFDASLIGYGGEDWELAFRAYNAGGVFVHDPQARAAHLEPDFGERTAHDEAERLRLKNAETSALARRITHPLARPDGVIFSRQDIGVWLPPHTPEAVISAWLAAGDVRVTHPVPELLAEDPRVDPGPTRITIEVDLPIGPPQDLAGVVSRVEELGGRGMLYDAHQAYASPIGRVTLRRNDQAHPAKIGVRWAEVTAPAQLERWCAGW